MFLGDSNTKSKGDNADEKITESKSGNTDKGSTPYDVSKGIGKESGKNIYIDWSECSEQIPSSDDMSLNTLFEMCSESCPVGISTLKCLYNSSLAEEISRRDAIKIIALILDNKAGEAATEISKTLRRKGGAAT